MSRRGHARNRGVLALATIALAIASIGIQLVAAPAQGSVPRPHVRVIAPGVTLTTYIDRRVPVRAYVLSVDLAQGASIGSALAAGGLGHLEKTSGMQKAAGAIAAVNGDFGSNSHRPTHPMALAGDLVQTSPVLAAMFSVSSDGTMRIGKPTESVSVTEVDTGETWPITAWNHGRPDVGDLMAFTAAGGSLEQPGPFACSARLLPSAPPSPTADGNGREYTVDESACASQRMSPGEGVVLSAVPSTPEATFLRSLAPGEAIQLTWSLGWPGIVDAIGGSTVLVSDGRPTLSSCSGAICTRNPRTAIGITADGRVLLVVVDGRQKTSVGMSLLELGRFLAALGVQSAMNLDGGGSSTVAVRGQVVNHPSDGFERSVTSAIVVRTGA